MRMLSMILMKNRKWNHWLTLMLTLVTYDGNDDNTEIQHSKEKVDYLVAFQEEVK